MVVGVWWHLLEGGGAEDMEECEKAPLRSLYKPSASDPATASCTCSNPSASNHCSSSLSTLSCLSKSTPWKREKRSITKAKHNHKIVKEQSERLSNSQQREIPDSTTPVPPPPPMPAPFLFPSTPNPPHSLLLLLPLALPLLTTHLQMKTTPK